MASIYWVDVNDEVPPIDEELLIAIAGREVADKGYFSIPEYGYDKPIFAYSTNPHWSDDLDVTHWAFMPKTPKTKEHGKG